jgi:uncharacterized protein (DUF736 family)
MNIDELKEIEGKSGKTLSGSIATLQITLLIELQPAPPSDNPKVPAYNVLARSENGIWIKVGAAWIKTITRGTNSGEEFLTLTIDDPSLRRPLNVAAFKNLVTGHWDIMYRRRQEAA